MTRPKVVLFDVNETLLDLAPLKQSVGEALGGRSELVPLWFTTLLQHSLVTTVAGRYHDFGEIAVACLRMVAGGQGIELGQAEAKQAIAPIRSLPPHPDVRPALERLGEAEYRLLALTNSSSAALGEQLQNAGLDGLLEAALSVEQVGLYKPHRRVYRWAADLAGVDISECLVVAAHGWDVAGAAWAGMRAAFIARPGQQPFPLGPQPDFAVTTLEDLANELMTLH